MQNIFLNIAGHWGLLEIPEIVCLYTYLPNFRSFQFNALPVGEDLLFRVKCEKNPNLLIKEIASFTFEQQRRITIHHIVNSLDDFYVTFQFVNQERQYTMWVRDDWQTFSVDIPVWDEYAYIALNELLMIVFIYSSAKRDTIFIHSSAIKYGNEAVSFIGHSGVGKSTHSRLWLTYIESSELLNDDQPALRIHKGKVMIYGTPWSGKTPCYKNESAVLKAFFFMQQALDNKAIPMEPMQAFQQLLASCSMIQDERVSFNRIINTLSKVVALVPSFTLQNRPEEAAALLSFRTSLLTPLK